MYSLPYEIKATAGSHNLDNCETCRTSLKKLEENFTGRFAGNETKPGFLLCREWHKNLLNIKAFDRNVSLHYALDLEERQAQRQEAGNIFKMV